MTVASKNRWLAAEVCAVACFLVLIQAGIAPDRADAVDVGCGDTLAANTTLESDLTCSGDGLVIGADGITVDLNGHMIRSTCSVAPCPVTAGIDNGEGYDHVRITNGSLDGFEQGVVLDGARHNTLSGLSVSGGGYLRGGSNAVVLSDSADNVIKDSSIQDGDPALLLVGSDRNTISRIDIGGGIAIHVGGGAWLQQGSDNNRIGNSDIGGFAGGISISRSHGNALLRSSSSGYFTALVLDGADDTTISRSTLTAPPFVHSLEATDSDRSRIVRTVASGSGFEVDGSRNRIALNDARAMAIDGNRNRIARNEVSQGAPDVPALLVAGGARNVATRNSSTDGGSIAVAAPATHTVLARNLVTDANSDGFLVEAPGTVVRRNTASDNKALGINAVAGVIDGGGNHASGNGNPLQCVNIACTP